MPEWLRYVLGLAIIAGAALAGLALMVWAGHRPGREPGRAVRILRGGWRLARAFHAWRTQHIAAWRASLPRETWALLLLAPATIAAVAFGIPFVADRIAGWTFWFSSQLVARTFLSPGAWWGAALAWLVGIQNERLRGPRNTARVETLLPAPFVLGSAVAMACYGIGLLLAPGAAGVPSTGPLAGKWWLFQPAACAFAITSIATRGAGKKSPGTILFNGAIGWFVANLVLGFAGGYGLRLLGGILPPFLRQYDFLRSTDFLWCIALPGAFLLLWSAAEERGIPEPAEAPAAEA